MSCPALPVAQWTVRVQLHFSPSLGLDCPDAQDSTADSPSAARWAEQRLKDPPLKGCCSSGAGIWDGGIKSFTELSFQGLPGAPPRPRSPITALTLQSP